MTIKYPKTLGAPGRSIPEYKVWKGMKGRCYRKRCAAYHCYGGRGIQVCERWRNSFEAFYADLGPRPTKSHRLERIDNDGHYEPENCRWATQIEQSRNTRTSIRLSFRGKTKSLTDWADELHIKACTIRSRLFRGWKVEDALTSPLRINQHG